MPPTSRAKDDWPMHRHHLPSPLWWISVAALVVGCAAAPPSAPPPAPAENHWAIERVVDTSRGMISLFDPQDLAHHASDPADWYRHAFAFSNDLQTGRFAAVLTGSDGPFQVVVTSAPLSARERAAAGPRAVQRLRVVNRRLLLAGGDAWPSLANPRLPGPVDKRWINVANGDYRVTITVLDPTLDLSVPDIVFRLEAVETLDAVAYAPGMPQLIVGSPPAVAGTDPSSLRYSERCTEVGRSAPWSPLIDTSLPLPGSSTVVRVPDGLHARRRLLENAALPANEPLIIARSPTVGSVGVQFAPRRWLPPRREQGRYRELFEATGRVSCAVRITGVDGVGDELRLLVEPLPSSRDRLPPELARRLTDRLESYLALSNDPAWRYKSGRVRYAPDDGSRVMAAIDQLGLPATEIEALMPQSNEVRALRLLDRMAEPPR